MMKPTIYLSFCIFQFLLELQQCQATTRSHDGKSVGTDDIKAGYDHIAARYSSWAEQKKRKSLKPAIKYGELKLAVADDATVDAPADVNTRGKLIKLNAVGGYPKMLGETYNAEVGMGTPAKLFNLTADTGSMLTWAVDASCHPEDCPGVKEKNTYDPSKSSTSKLLRSDHEAYGDGEMDLNLFNDVVSLGGFSIDATVGGANKTFEKDGQLQHDGLLGLGRELSADPEPILDSLAKQDTKFTQIIALDLGSQPSLEIGGYDFTKYTKMINFKVSGDQGWLLEQSSITARGAAETRPVDMMVDTGSSVSMFPASRMDAIMNRPGLKVSKTETEPIVYSMPCDTVLNVEMILPDGTKIPVRDQDILIKSSETPGCLSLLVGTTNPFLPSVAGTPLLKSIYTVLRRTETGDWIGLAPLQQSKQ